MSASGVGVGEVGGLWLSDSWSSYNGLIRSADDNKLIINLTALWFQAKNYAAEGLRVRVWVVKFTKQ